jgi:hypothetical protein
MVSNLWWVKNNHVFKDNIIPPKVIAGITLSMVEEFKSKMKVKNPIKPALSDIDYEIPWGLFDRAFQGHLLMCGVRVVLHISQKHYVHIWHAPGAGTNNRDEFVALWTLLEAAIKKMSGNFQ